jgi:hypothetical protein
LRDLIGISEQDNAPHVRKEGVQESAAKQLFRVFFGDPRPPCDGRDAAVDAVHAFTSRDRRFARGFRELTRMIGKTADHVIIANCEMPKRLWLVQKGDIGV